MNNDFSLNNEINNNRLRFLIFNIIVQVLKALAFPPEILFIFVFSLEFSPCMIAYLQGKGTAVIARVDITNLTGSGVTQQTSLACKE